MQVEGQHGTSVLVATGARVRNAYATYLIQRDSPWKRGLIPYGTVKLHSLTVKTSVV